MQTIKTQRSQATHTRSFRDNLSQASNGPLVSAAVYSFPRKWRNVGDLVVKDNAQSQKVGTTETAWRIACRVNESYHDIFRAFFQQPSEPPASHIIPTEPLRDCPAHTANPVPNLNSKLGFKSVNLAVNSRNRLR